ncbi:MAG: pilus assembly protein N-terminal domain-containing protein [Steroidobacteraceae bacterium]
MCSGRHSVIGSWICLLFCVPCAHAQAAQPSRSEHLQMVVGDTELLQVLDVKRVAVGNGRVASVSAVDTHSLLVLAESAGNTGVRVWQADGSVRELQISVSAMRGTELLERVRQLLGPTDHLRARLVGELVIIEGEQIAQLERERLTALLKLMPAQLVDLTDHVGWDAMIQMQVRIVELRRTRGENLGLRWLEQMGGPSLAVQAGSDGSRSATLRWDATLSSALELLVKRGVARLVAEPVLSCRSGGRAHFVSGGEMPVPVLDGNGTPDVQYKEYGVILDVQPTADRDGNVFARLEAEVSDVDNSVQVMGVPGLLKRHSTTEVNVRLGETIVVAGLSRHSRSNDRQGLPLLSAIPLLGGLFRTRAAEQSDSELLVLITPRLISAGAGTEAAQLNQEQRGRFDSLLGEEALP